MFLWVYWPSFNGGAASSGDAQQRAVLNTYYSLCACVLSTLACSALISPGRKLNPAHLQVAGSQEEPLGEDSHIDFEFC